MKKTQQNQQAMGNGVFACLSQNNLIWNGNSILTDNYLLLQQDLADISNWQDKQTSVMLNRGYSRDKGVMESLLIDSVMIMVGAVKSFGAQTGNYAIYTSINYTTSKLARMSASNFVSACTNVHTVALANLSDLADYGVTAPALTLLLADINAYKALLPKIKVNKANVKMFTANLELACKKMMLNLKERIDNNMELYRNDRAFFMAYKNSRKIYNYNSATTGLEGYVKDAETGMLIKNCLIEVLMPGNSRQTSTNTRAHFSFKRLEMKRCTIRVRSLHYTTAEFEVELAKDKITHYDIMMIAEPVTAAASVNA